MKGILTAIFVGVFVGALGYEAYRRTDPAVTNRIRNNVSGAVDKLMWTGDIVKAKLARRINARYPRRTIFSRRQT